MLKAPEDWGGRVALHGRFYRQLPKQSVALPIIKRPTIVVLCGSARFRKELDEANLKETLAGNIVLSLCPGLGDRKKADKIHREKIKLADEVLVVNPGGYIGPSTRSEIAYAKRKGKQVRYWQ